ncbi:response regulator [Allohahella marinimesophila]|uniref:histidine kinase n=1 Tax=Allohahella marinimesophila TaxID=1054972 RepID=A0ABP7PAM3_9GAMM
MPAPSSPAVAFIAGDSEMAARMRALDWSTTPLGAPEDWPQSLKAAVRIMLTSRYAMWMSWGPDNIFFCNDAYKPTLGVKQEWALGAPAAKVWAEIWPAIGPLISTVMETGVASWNEDMLLFLERSGVPEETYHTFSYSPLADDDSAVVGMLCVVTEETLRVIGERRMATLRDLAAAFNTLIRQDDVLQASARQLEANQKDLPFTMTYLFDADGEATLACSSGLPSDSPLAPPTVTRDADLDWPLTSIFDVTGPVRQASARTAQRPTGAWDLPPREALILPLHMQGQQQPAGVFIAALNPYRPVDQDYEAFLELAANQLAAALANARAYEHARQRAEALAEIDRAKTAFFSNVSHEFRTPLTLMLGPLEESLANTALPQADLEGLKLAHRNASRLLKLVNSLLDFSRIEAGRVQAYYVPTDIAAITSDLASNFRSATERAQLELIADCKPLREPIYMDRDMWEKVVLNLLSNALKFTFEGQICVRVDELEGAARLTISDTGTGIPARELPRMFERFHRIAGARGRSFEGSGIGLALVQELVHLHGGDISVASTEGSGTTFTVSLPFGSSHLPDEQIHAAPHREVNHARSAGYVEEALSWLQDHSEKALIALDEHERVRPAGLETPSGVDRPSGFILLADDNADMRAYLQRLLGATHECAVAADGQEALELIQQRRPDLLITDIMMPRMDGFALIREIRNDTELRDLPIIALSARAGEEARIEGLSGGADDYLVKPFSAKELIARVEAALTIAEVRRQMHEALRESEARFRYMADNAPVMIWTTDPSGVCTYLSRSWYQFTGQTPETGLGFGWLDATHPDDKPAAEATFVRANADHSAFSLEYRLRRHDGTYRYAIDAAAPWFDAQGQFLGYIGSVIDISERREVEEAQRQINLMLEQRVAEAISAREQTENQLRQAQKMEAIGKLTGGVAHDFNNLLQIISGNLELLARDVTGNDRAEQRISHALEGAARGAKLASQLLAFGRRQPLAPKSVNIGRHLRSIDHLLRRALGEGVEIETVVGGGLWNTLIDASQLENALLNLAINARDAMGGHGKLTIEAGNAVLDAEYATNHLEVRAGQYVMLAVSDTGCGIPADVIDRVFEPFFTTKPEGQGTGLGLSMVYGFVKQSGGHTKIYSEAEQGTTVRLYLPRTRQEEDLATIVESSPVVSGTETVLVVEDDETVRSTVVALLSDLGYRVLKASDAASALVIVESGAHIDVLFTDVVMPGKLRSPELARKAQDRLPNLAVLFTSGYTDNAIVHGGRLDEDIELLSKPYTREQLARKMRHVLRKPPVSESSGRAMKRVLFVEDDDLLRSTTTDLLRLLGFTVFPAASASEALAVLKDNTVDVLMADHGLPDLTDLQLAEKARQHFPELPILIASGHDLAISAETPGMALLQKPYNSLELQQALAAVIQSAAAG